MQKIKNIIFDLGGVIINIDYQLTVDAFRKLGIKNINEVFSQIKQTELFDLFETGKISSHEFRTTLLKYTSNTITTSEINNAWNAMLLDVPKERIKLLAELNKYYNIVVLSNTNEIHIHEFANILQQNHGFRDLSHLFKKVYYSYEIGYRKPNEDVFHFVLNDSGFIAHETLFIDDSLQHIQGANKIGIHTLHLKPELNINQIFGESFSIKEEFISQMSTI